jgi:hypothetical protein
VRINRVLIIAFIIAMAGYSCREKGGKYIDQGEIHYNIEYIGSFGGMPKEVLPQNLVVSFKKDKTLFEMIGFGKSGILNLSNPEEDIFDTYFSFFTTRLYYSAKSGEMFPGFENMEGIEFKKTSKTTTICGFNCKNVEVKLPSYPDKVLSVWYTNEIKLKNPNAATPFNAIDGVLMDFFFIMGEYQVHFVAETVYQKDIPDETFERRTKYERVSRESIQKFMNKMLSL